MERLERGERISSVHVAQLTVDVLQDLGVGLVLGSVAAERALRESRGQRSPNLSPHPQTLPDFPKILKGAEESVFQNFPGK